MATNNENEYLNKYKYIDKDTGKVDTSKYVKNGLLRETPLDSKGKPTGTTQFQLAGRRPEDGGTLRESDQIMKDFMRSSMIIPEDKDKWSLRFNRLKFPNPYYAFGETREVLFFVKPKLNITLSYINSGWYKDLNPELASYPFWREMIDKYGRSIEQLQFSAGYHHTRNPFAPMLTNAVMSKLDLPTISADSTQTANTIFGTQIDYRGSSYKSDEGFDFSLQFMDNKDLEMYHYFKMYDEYQKLKELGIVSPPFPNIGNNKASYSRENLLKSTKISEYTTNKVLHDQMGIYKFILDEDLTTILYYGYVCGAYPKSVPRDSFDDVNAGILVHSTDWHGQFVEDMNPQILSDFNMVTLAYRKSATSSKSEFGKKTRPIWNDKYGFIEGNWMACPVVTQYDSNYKNTKKRYCLEWYRYSEDDRITNWTGR